MRGGSLFLFGTYAEWLETGKVAGEGLFRGVLRSAGQTLVFVARVNEP
jgi:hypothetical protein